MPDGNVFVLTGLLEISDMESDSFDFDDSLPFTVIKALQGQLKMMRKLLKGNNNKKN